MLKHMGKKIFTIFVYLNLCIQRVKVVPFKRTGPVNKISILVAPSADSFKKGCCQLQAKVCARITG